jgi:hypothetical protein
MKNKQMAIAIRATNERTLDLLVQQLNLQKQPGDAIKVFGDQEPFPDKMLKVFEWCMAQDKPISLVVDADILLRRNALQIIRKKFGRLPQKRSGFGVMLFDRFFKRPKFRGLNVYRTSYLNLFVEHLPKVRHSLRPESDLQKLVGTLGHPYKNDFVKFYVAGLHDYFQYYRDIYFKMLIRSQRSQDLIAINYIGNDGTEEAEIAHRGLADGQKLKSLFLDKTKVAWPKDIINQQPLQEGIDVDSRVVKELRQHYGNTLFYWAGKFIWFEKILVYYLKLRRPFSA